MAATAVISLHQDLRPLRIREFRIFWVGHAVSCLGDGMVPLVTAFAVIGQGGGAVELGTVLAVGMLCRLVATLIGGVVADRLPRRRVMACADGVRCLSQLSLGVLAATGHGSALVLAVGNAVYGIAAGFHGPASKGLMPSLVGKELLQQAAALQSLVRSASMIAGPVVAGMLIPLVGTKAVYFLDSGTFAVNFVALLMLPAATARGMRGQSFAADLVQGWSEIVSRRWVAANLVVHALWNFGMAVFFVLGPVLAQQRFGGAAAWGVVSAGMAVGALVGGVIALRWRPRLPLVAGNLVLAASVLPLLTLWLELPMAWVVVAAAVGDCCMILLNTLWDATLQRVIPEQVLSRVSSYDFLLTVVSMPLAYALIGPLTEQIGTSGVLLAGAALVAVPCVLVCLLPAVRGITGPQRAVEPAPRPEATAEAV
ncbi:MFS transporter [Streptomyces sp. NBC_01439]|uniref:MFS transporter n=1 Tax=Streptomyces sp. NBC_01439 TaxID=2903867 RepID=UPI002E2C1E53|nr:MFS transporter [Streptomyces sp. NBC_01439]